MAGMQERQASSTRRCSVPARRFALGSLLGILVLALPQVSVGRADRLAMTITPRIATSSDGSVQTIYAFPDGEVITVTTPPRGFDPLDATTADLARFGFPLPPTDATDLVEWTDAMADFRSDEPPTESLRFVPGDDSSTRYATCPLYCAWGGYTAGTWDTQTHKYVAVKGVLHVPTNAGACGDSNGVAFWIGMGGTGGDDPLDNLVQQGIECGNSDLGAGSAYRPWTEFATTALPKNFCGFSSWTLAAGDKIYQNMSFQTSQNKAFFYLEDQTTGVAHSCSHTPPTGWHWNLNTAEWVGEAPGGASVDFDHVNFTNAKAQLYSDSSWVSLGSQSETRVVDGAGTIGGHLYQCIVPGSISSGTDFTDSWVATQCRPPQ